MKRFIRNVDTVIFLVGLILVLIGSWQIYRLGSSYLIVTLSGTILMTVGAYATDKKNLKQLKIFNDFIDQIPELKNALEEMTDPTK